jgi:molybdate transport system substrate-binding protein
VSRRLSLLLLALLTLSACGPAGASGREVTVLAAASLTDAFTELGDAFEAANDAVTVRFGFAGSQQLATQVVEGAPADVLATADMAQMEIVAAAGATAGAPTPFAGNRLTIAVEPGNPLAIGTLADLADPDLALVLAAEEVPAGRYARALIDAADVALAPASLETDVRAVLAKVALGEADAGIVYVSDVVAAGDDVSRVDLPDDHDVTASYPIALLAGARSPDLGQAFIDLVQSDEGQAVLAEHGFVPAS